MASELETYAQYHFKVYLRINGDSTEARVRAGSLSLSCNGKSPEKALREMAEMLTFLLETHESKIHLHVQPEEP